MISRAAVIVTALDLVTALYSRIGWPPPSQANQVDYLIRQMGINDPVPDAAKIALAALRDGGLPIEARVFQAIFFEAWLGAARHG